MSQVSVAEVTQDVETNLTDINVNNMKKVSSNTTTVLLLDTPLIKIILWSFT
jgi:hypothetical protein